MCSLSLDSGSYPLKIDLLLKKYLVLATMCLYLPPLLD